jgi:hypothetical protein
MKCSTCPADCYADAVVVGERTLCRACADMWRVILDATLVRVAADVVGLDERIGTLHARAVALRAKPEPGGATWAEAAKLRAERDAARGDVLRLERRVGEQRDRIEELEAPVVPAGLGDAGGDAAVLLTSATIHDLTQRLEHERRQSRAALLAERSDRRQAKDDLAATSAALDTATGLLLRRDEAIAKHCARAEKAEAEVARLIEETDALRDANRNAAAEVARLRAVEATSSSIIAWCEGKTTALGNSDVEAALKRHAAALFERTEGAVDDQRARADAAERTVAALVEGLRTVRRLADKEIVGCGEHSISMLESIVAMCDVADPVAAGARERWVPREDLDRQAIAMGQCHADGVAELGDRIAVLERALGEAAEVFEGYARHHEDKAESWTGSSRHDARAESLAKAEANRAHAAKLRGLLASDAKERRNEAMRDVGAALAELPDVVVDEALPKEPAP